MPPPLRPFHYLGRCDLVSEPLIRSATEAVVFDDPHEIESYVERISKKITDNGAPFNLISDENFLRPHSDALLGLNTFVRLMAQRFDVVVYVSVRPLKSMVVSWFKHDLGRIKGLTHIQNYLPLLFWKIILHYAIFLEYECIYPYCNENSVKCKCGLVKKIPINFYDIAWLKSRLDFDFKVCNFLGPKNNLQSELIFGWKKIFPLRRYNVTIFPLRKRMNFFIEREVTNAIKRLRN